MTAHTATVSRAVSRSPPSAWKRCPSRSSACPASPKRITTKEPAKPEADRVAGSPLFLVAVACLTFAVDRASKLAVQHFLPLGTSREVAGGVLYIDHTQNTGAAFSMAPSLGNLFLAFAVVATVVIIYYYRHVPRSEVWTRLALGMVLGGALGNALDRVVAGSVTDFIDVRVWPVFNLADSAIVVGVAIIIWRLSVRSGAADE